MTGMVGYGIEPTNEVAVAKFGTIRAKLGPNRCVLRNEKYHIKVGEVAVMGRSRRPFVGRRPRDKEQIRVLEAVCEQRKDKTE